MIKFDKNSLIARLSHVSAPSKAMFSLCCATRQVASWEEYARHFCPKHEGDFRNFAELMWSALASNIVPIKWEPTLEDVMALLPDEENDSSHLHAYAQDAVSSLAYTVRCLIDGSPQEAAWSANAAYDTTDQAAIRQLRIEPQGAAAEQQLLTHLYVQRELGRQERDLQILERQSFREVLDQLKLTALNEQTLSLNEMNG